MIKEYLASIDGMVFLACCILLAFFILFVTLVWRTAVMSQQEREEASRLPLEGEGQIQEKISS